MPQNSKDIDKLIGNLLGADTSKSYSNDPLSQGQNNAVNAKLAPVLNFMIISIENDCNITLESVLKYIINADTCLAHETGCHYEGEAPR